MIVGMVIFEFYSKEKEINMFGIVLRNYSDISHKIDFFLFIVI